MLGRLVEQDNGNSLVSVPSGEVLLMPSSGVQDYSTENTAHVPGQAVGEEDRFRSTMPARDAVESQFQDLVAQWKEQRAFMSSPVDMALLPAYQRIIGMGPAAVPLLLRELEREPDHWFWALKAITGADPAGSASRGVIAEIAHSWLEWGKAQGFRW